MCANKSGGEVDTVLTDISALYFEIDTTIGRIYWIDHNNDSLMYCNLDGSERTGLMYAGGVIYSIALYINPLTVLVEDKKNMNPDKFIVSQNYPNPFNPITNVKLFIPKTEYVNLKIYNVLGQEIAKLVSGELKAGQHTYVWNTSQFASGIYYYQVEINSGENSTIVDTKKLILLK